MDASVNLSLLSLFLEAGRVVQLVMLILFFMSIISWTIIFNKSAILRGLNHKILRFVGSLDQEHSLTELFEKAKKSQDIGSQLFVRAVSEVQDAKKQHRISDTHFRQDLESTLVAKSNMQLIEAEKSLGFLATVGSSAVFIGLFGTVWGIMDSFQSIGVAKNTSLAVVAPGIAEALLATAMGLIAAIPAKMFYNKFASDINRIAANIDILIPSIIKKIMIEAKK